ncbi:MAG TPA: phosphohydrolase [Clostridium sp.]|nr:phosphohydrolase [Clostridium sp.]HHU98105.1 phosphohydrolase [Petrimonas sp.]
MKCFYHNDLDGKCAGAIVYKYYVRGGNLDKSERAVFIPIDYKDSFPFGSINNNELVVIVDFSLEKPGDFECLLDITENVIWIDHHKSAIEKHNGLDIKGIRKDGTAGCELAWKYFYPNNPMPKVVELVGDYDVWKFKYGDDTRNFQAGIGLFENNPESDNWLDWLWDRFKPNSIINKGKTVMKYRNNYYKDLVYSISFPTEFEGYTAIACNACKVGSMLFDSVADMNFDLMLPFYFDGNQWVVSMYTTKEIDCSEIAKKYGGGGHKQAAGFQCKELPFCKNI